MSYVERFNECRWAPYSWARFKHNPPLIVTRQSGAGPKRKPADLLSPQYRERALQERHNELLELCGGKAGLKMQLMYTLGRTPGLVYDALEEFRDRMKVRARDKMTQMTMRQAVMLLCPPYNLTREAYQGMRGLFPGLFPPLWRLDVERAGCKTVLEDIPGVQDGAMVKHPMAMIICDMKDYKDGINWSTTDYNEAMGDEGGDSGSDPAAAAALAAAGETLYYKPLPWEVDNEPVSHHWAAWIVNEGGDGQSVTKQDGSATPHAAAGFGMVRRGGELVAHPNSPYELRPLAKVTGVGEEALLPASERLDDDIGRYGGSSKTNPTLGDVRVAIMNTADEKKQHADMGTAGRAWRISSTHIS
jgi:hypothetical protein